MIRDEVNGVNDHIDIDPTWKVSKITSAPKRTRLGMQMASHWIATPWSWFITCQAEQNVRQSVERQHAWWTRHDIMCGVANQTIRHILALIKGYTCYSSLPCFKKLIIEGYICYSGTLSLYWVSHSVKFNFSVRVRWTLFRLICLPGGHGHTRESEVAKIELFRNWPCLMWRHIPFPRPWEQSLNTAEYHTSYSRLVHRRSYFPLFVPQTTVLAHDLLVKLSFFCFSA